MGPNSKSYMSQFGQTNLCGRVIHLLHPKFFWTDCVVSCICRVYHVIEHHQRTLHCIMKGRQVSQKAIKNWSRKREHLIWKGESLWTCMRAHCKKSNRGLSKVMKPPEKVFCFLISWFLWGEGCFCGNRYFLTGSIWDSICFFINILSLYRSIRTYFSVVLLVVHFTLRNCSIFQYAVQTQDVHWPPKWILSFTISCHQMIHALQNVRRNNKLKIMY